MPFSKAFMRQLLPLLFFTAIWDPSGKPSLAQENTKAPDKSTEAQTTPAAASPASEPGATAVPSPASEATTVTSATPGLATRPVNEKILPMIKEGYAYLSKGSYDKAITVLKKAVSIDNESISARRYLAYALIQTNQAKEALDEMQTVSKLVPPNAFDFYLFAASYYAAGGVKEAKDCYNEALRQNPAYDAARAGLVKTLAREHNFEEALNIVQQGLQLAKDDAVKKYYTSLSKAVIEAQNYQIQTANGGIMPGNISTTGTQAGGDSIKSKPVIIK